MDAGSFLQVFSLAVLLALKLVAPLLLTTVVVGLLISLFQAVTQINESTLAFIPKLAVMVLVFWLTLPWMVQEAVGFTVEVLKLASGAAR